MNGFGHLHSTKSRYSVFLTTVHCRFHLWKQTSPCSQFFSSAALRIYPHLTLPLNSAAYISLFKLMELLCSAVFFNETKSSVQPSHVFWALGYGFAGALSLSTFIKSF